MKFFCEYCGCRIDAEIDKKCPNCGASYKKNATFIKLQNEENERKNKINDFQDQVLEHTKSAFKVSKVVFIIPIIMFIAVLTIIIFSFMRAQNRYNNLKSNKNKTTIEEQINNNEEQKNNSVTVNGLNVFGETSNYGAKVTNYEDVTFWYKEASVGYKFVKFYLEVENLSDGEIRGQDVNCIVNGVAQTNASTPGYSTIPFFISKGLTVKGEATFEVPVDATSYDIRYGDNITIHIEK